MAPSYQAFYGLAEPPFSLTSDPRFVYESRAYTIAVNEVTHAVERREGLIVLTGGPGTGKTSLCRALLQHLGPNTKLSAIPSPLVSGAELLSQIVGDFGLIFPSDLNAFLAELIPRGAYAVVIIDEAQYLDKDALEQVRRLVSLEEGSAKLLQIILVGQPELRAMIAREAPALDRLVAQRSVLRPLAPDEVGPYLERRVEVARARARGVDDQEPGAAVLFTTEAVSAVAQLSRGVPRMINRIADRSLDIAAEHRARSIDTDVVFTAADRLQVLRDEPEQPKNTRLTVMAVTALVLAVIATGVWWWVSRPKTGGAPSRVETASTLAADAPTGARPTASSPATAPRVGTMPTLDGVVLAVASFRSESLANDTIKALEGNGLPVFSRLDSRRRLRAVLVGPFVTREEALEAQKALEALRYRDTRIIVESASRR